MNHSQLTRFAEFCDSMATVEDLITVLHRSLDFVRELIHPAYITVQLFDTLKLKFIREERFGVCQPRSVFPCLEFSTDVIGCVDRGGDLLSLPDEHVNKYLFLFDLEQHLPCDLRIPFFVYDKYIGIFSFGQKESKEKYSVSDIDLLRVFVNYIALKSELLEIRSCTAQQDQKKPAAVSVAAVHPKPRMTFKIRDESSELIGESAAVQSVRDLIEKISREDVPVLITGESGTGKELVARDIHRKSTRSQKLLVTMNCAALPEALVESELFGHEKGAFTGALYLKNGKFEIANHTTLFLDEIGDMSLATQAKVLRVLQDGTFQRVGGNKTLFADVRLLTATNKNMTHLLQQRLFREDLYYRINVVQIQLPPLRERGEDIHILTRHFFDYYNQFYRKNLADIDPSVLDFLFHYSFPGNVRELKNIIERAVIMERKTKLTMDSISVIGSNVPPKNNDTDQQVTSLDDLERKHIMEIMHQVNDNKTRAAELLGIARKTLREKLLKYHIE